MQEVPQSKNKKGVNIKISKTIETEDGKVEFQGEVNQDELDLIITVGLNYLFQQGAIPFRVLPEAELAKTMAPGSDSPQ